MEKHILVIFPHPDDESFSSGGFIVSQSQAGVPVTYICTTYGEMGRNMGKSVHANRETMREIRKKELRDACDHLGIGEIKYLGYRDKTLEFEDINHVSSRILEIIKEVNPSLIITFYPGYAVHPDHNATGEAVVHAVAQLNESDRPVVYGVAFSNDSYDKLGEPDIVKDVSAFTEIKINAIKAHVSQTEAMLDAMGGSEVANKWLGHEKFYLL